MAVSAQVPRQRAASVPNSTPSASEITKAVPVSSSVAGSRSRISFEHRHLLAKREAEIEAEDALEIEIELHRQRLIQAELFAQLGEEDLVARARLAGHHQRRIARRHADQAEVQDDDREQNDNRLHDSLGNECEH